jgi:protein-disulfide isomerase
MSPFTPASSSSTPPTWLGFVWGLLGGVAASCLVIGFVAGYSMGGGSLATGTVAQNPPAVPSVPSVPDTPSKPVPEVTDEDHVRGNPNAKVTVIEYSDFECPFCKRNVDTMEQILEEYKDQVNIVYRHFPLGFHQNAQKEAEASECIADLGGNDAFWKFHDAIFERSTTNGTGFALDKLGPLAKELGVNQAKFQECLDSGKYASLVQGQMQSGADAGVQGTPGHFVINNETKDSKDISGAVPFSTFKTTIDEMLKS